MAIDKDSDLIGRLTVVVPLFGVGVSATLAAARAQKSPMDRELMNE